MKTKKTNYLHNLLHCMLMAACLACLASCSEDTEQKENPLPSPGGDTPGDKREIVLTLKNKLKLATKADANQPTSATKADTGKSGSGNADAPATKADGDLIATDAENEIASMDIYVFGSDTENGLYSFQEMLYYRADGSSIEQQWATPFELLQKSDNETNALLQLKKGLYVKLYIVANHPGIAGSIDGVAEPTELTYDRFSALVMTGTGDKGRVVSKVGIPTEDNFQNFRTPLLNPNNADDVLRTPLTMVGSYLTPVDLTDFAVNTRLQIGFKLTRLSARFDVVNDAAASKLTIQSISMANGRSGSGLFPIRPYRAEAPLKDDLISYPARKFDGAQTAADRLVKGAFYSYPSPIEDKACLVVNGLYAVNQTEKKEVTYQIPFKQITDGTGNYIEIAHNHRYTLYITDADEYHLDVNIQVADWDDAGSIDDYQPDTAPDNLEIVIDKMNGEYYPAINTISLMLDKDNFCTISTASNSGVTMTYGYDGGDIQHNWLIVEKVKEEETQTKSAFPAPRADALPGTTKYTYKCYPDPEYKQNIFPRARVVFKDNATGQEQFVYIRPYGKPEVHAIAKTAGDLNPNSYVDSTFVLTLYRALQSTLPLRVVCPDGSEVGQKPAWLDVQKNESMSNATETYYTLTVTDTLANADNTDYALEFVNANEKTLVTPITIKMVNAGIDRGWVAGELNTLNADSTELTMPLVHDNYFNIAFMSIEGVKVDLDFGEGNPHWLTHNGPIFTKAGTVRNSIKFFLDNNKLVGAKPVKVTMTNDYRGQQFKFTVIPVPQIPILPDAATTLSPTNNSYTKSSKQIAIYKHSSTTSSVKLKVLTPGGCQIVNPLSSWLQVQKDSTDYRTCNLTFSIAPGATAPIDGKTYTVKLQNMTDPTKEVSLTIVPKFDVPTVKLNSVSHANFNGYSETAGNKLVTLYDAPNGSSWVKLNISALGGSKFTNVPNWITISPASVTNATSGTYTLTLNKAVLKAGEVLNNNLIRLENAYNKNTYTEIRVQRISSTITASYKNIANTSGNPTAVNMTTYNGNASFSLNLNSANGFKASANWNGGTANWLTFDTKTFAKGSQTLTFSLNVSNASGAKETTITLANQLPGGPNYTFKVKPVFKAPTVERSSGTPAGNSLIGNTITLYKLNSGSSTIQLKLSAIGGSKISYSGGNNVSFSRTSFDTVDGYYTLTANAASGGGTLTVMNYSDNNQKATYNIVLKSGEVTAGNLSVTAANSGSTNIPVTAELGVNAAVTNWGSGGGQWFDITTASTNPSGSAQNIVITQRNNIYTIMKPTTIRLTSKNGGGYRDIVVTPTFSNPTLSATSATLNNYVLNNGPATFNITNAAGNMDVAVTSGGASVSRSDNRVTVQPTLNGKTTIVVTNKSDNSKKSTYTLQVNCARHYQNKPVWIYYGYYIAPEDAANSVQWTNNLTATYCSNKTGATWYVPSDAEWRAILGGTSGSDDAAPAVFNEYKRKGVFPSSTRFWSTTESSSSSAYSMTFNSTNAYVYPRNKSDFRRVRCVAR